MDGKVWDIDWALGFGIGGRVLIGLDWTVCHMGFALFDASIKSCITGFLI